MLTVDYSVKGYKVNIMKYRIDKAFEDFLKISRTIWILEYNLDRK